MECFLVDDFFGINQIYVRKFFSERLHISVRDGDIDLVEELLEEPGADINANYYGENLLWTAIMSREEEMATFLIDNGIDTTFKCCRIDLQEDEQPAVQDTSVDKKVIQVKLNLPSTVSKKTASNSSRASTESPAEEVSALADVFVVDCRQLAYEKEMFNIVNLIDYKQGCLLKWLKPPSHIVRLTKSAQLAKEAAEKQPVLPPDRKSPPMLTSRRRRMRRNYRFASTALSSPAIDTDTADKTQTESIKLPNANLAHRPSSTCDLESTLITKDPLEIEVWQKQSARSVHTATRRQCYTPRVRLTKTAVVRQRENNMSIKDQQYQLRHPESTETMLVRPHTRLQTDSEKRFITSDLSNGVVLSKPPLPKPSYSSYANHLPFRRKPILSDGYVERMFKKSVHGCRHSPQSASQRKPVGRF